MYDLHSHLLPAIDDGARSVEMALSMARTAVEDGIVCMACTPHIFPGVYENRGPDIRAAVAALQGRLIEEGIPLQLVTGADVHLAPGLAEGIRSGRVLSLNDSRYFLLEPPHDVLPPRLEEYVVNQVRLGYVPVITHPERLTWISGHYEILGRLVQAGALIQVTAGAVTGAFGRGVRQLAERMLDDGLVHILATDAHNTGGRPPILSAARDAVAHRLGDEEATRLVVTRPLAILNDSDPSQLAPLPRGKGRSMAGLLRRLFAA